MAEHSTTRNKPPSATPKLRVSCDQCGSAKLRCDRGQPRCGRCDSRGIPCVYSVSRKTGKPPRYKRQLRSSPNQTSVSQGQAGDTAAVAADADHGHDQDLTLATLDLGEWPAVTQFNVSPFPNTSLGPHNSYTTNFAAHPALPCLDQVLPHSDCWRRAYEMLGKVSMLEYPSLVATLSVDEVPFDHMLCLSREAMDQLNKLQSCSCAPCPSLAFLKASIMSKVLLWYHQSTIDLHAATTTTAAAASPTLPPANSIAVGAFSVDDARVQAALKIQLLLGELRRAGPLIDRFAVREEPTMNSINNRSSICGLYQHVAAWLKAEHGQIVQFLTSKLREVNN